jgi:hypothetical protein
MAKKKTIEERAEEKLAQLDVIDVQATRQVAEDLGEEIAQERTAEELAECSRRHTLDVEWAITQIQKHRAKGNASAGVVNEVLLELIGDDLLAREARAAVRESQR